MVTVKMPQLLLFLALAIAALVTVIAAEEDNAVLRKARICTKYDDGDEKYEKVELYPVDLFKVSDLYWSDRQLGGNRVAFDPSTNSVMMRTGQQAKEDAIVSFTYYIPENGGDVLAEYKYRIGRSDHCAVNIPQPPPGTKFSALIADYVTV